MENNNRIQYNFWIQKELLEQLRKSAEKEDRTVSSLLRTIVAKYLAEENKLNS